MEEQFPKRWWSKPEIPKSLSTLPPPTIPHPQGKNKQWKLCPRWVKLLIHSTIPSTAIPWKWTASLGLNMMYWAKTNKHESGSSIQTHHIPTPNKHIPPWLLKYMHTYIWYTKKRPLKYFQLKAKGCVFTHTHTKWNTQKSKQNYHKSLTVSAAQFHSHQQDYTNKHQGHRHCYPNKHITDNTIKVTIFTGKQWARLLFCGPSSLPFRAKITTASMVMESAWNSVQVWHNQKTQESLTWLSHNLFNSTYNEHTLTPNTAETQHALNPRTTIRQTPSLCLDLLNIQCKTNKTSAIREIKTWRPVWVFFFQLWW